MTAPPPPNATPVPWTPPSPLPAAIRTDRLVLRWFEAGDAQRLHEAVDSSRADCLPWLPWAEAGHESPEASAAVIADFDRRRAEGSDFTLGIFDCNTARVVGGTGLHRPKPQWHTAEIGYWLRSDARGSGICTEAVRHLISSAFTPQSAGGFGLRRLEIFCAAPNTASSAVPKRLGLGDPCRLQAERWVDTLGWTDSLAWDLLVQEWDTSAHAIARTTRA